ncbi:hypothetical protein BDF19DRAFT_439347, partial [Syncephalis fuscata]
MSAMPIVQQLFERIKEHKLTPEEEATLARIRDNSVRNVTGAGILGFASGIFYARYRRYRPFATFFFAGFAGMMGLQVGTMLSGWMARREIDKLPDSKKILQLLKEARDDIIRERIQRQRRSSSGQASGPDAILQNASVDRDGSDPIVGFENTNDGTTAQGGTPPANSDASGASSWHRVRSQNKPESAWDRLRAQQQQPSSNQNSAQNSDTANVWSEAPTSDTNMNSNSDESFPRTREDFERVRKTGHMRRNQYGDIID